MNKKAAKAAKAAHKKRRKAQKMSRKAQSLTAAGLVLSILFLPTTMLLVIGMLPTPAASLIDKKRQSSKMMTVGAMNLAGCTPFLMELWRHGNSFEKSFDIISDPKTIIIMYAAAGVGYMIDWSMTGLTSSMLYQRGVQRQEEIKKRQTALEERWGETVTGKVALDEDGFPIQKV